MQVEGLNTYQNALGISQSPHDKASGAEFIKKTLQDSGINVDKKDIGSISGKDISNAHFLNAMNITIQNNANAQVGLEFNASGITSLVSRDFLNEIGYSGKNLNDLSVDEAKKLLSDDGIFGVDKTSQRIADFIINGAGDDIQKLQDGRAGMMQGFSDAANIIGRSFGDFDLPQITKQTMQKAIELVDARIQELGANILDIQA